MSSAPSVIVGISTFNRSDVLAKSIASAKVQSYKPVRVSVVDDASTDNTPAIRNQFPEVTWERFSANQGYLRARNKMMLTATEDYYISLDDDAWFLEGDEIAVAIDYLENHPKVAAIAYDILSPDRSTPVERGREREVGLFIGCGHVLRLSVVRQLSGYKEFPGSYGSEEKDLCLRLIDAGYEIIQLDGVHVWHDKTMTARDILRQHRSGVCNDMILAVWRFPGARVAFVLVWKLASHVIFGVKNELLRPALSGLADFIRALPVALINRQPVKQASIARFRELTKEQN